MIKELFQNMVINKYLTEKNIDSADSLGQKTIDDLIRGANNNYDNLLSDIERESLENEKDENIVKTKLQELLEKTKINSYWDIQK